jgi:hypothetical protein
LVAISGPRNDFLPESREAPVWRSLTRVAMVASGQTEDTRGRWRRK